MIAILIPRIPGPPKRVRQTMTDAALVLSILSGGCMMERPQPDDDDDDDCDEACPDDGDDTGADGDDSSTAPHASTPPDGIPGSSDASCCSSHYGVGCQDHRVESCVCGLDPKCCTDGWDATCVMTAEQFCPIECSVDDGAWG